ncbi:MAG: glycosyltransferase family 2 protein [Candidatus Omnitrophica bacterium]|nr:glycosyltransferase family 2 protein [Candidatus Omnitrophota bacterium]
MAILSVVVLTYNSEGLIRGCLESAKWADEIIIVDSMSQDKTVDICKEYTDKIWQRPWPGYAKQWNFAIDQAKGDWIFILASDEEITPQLQSEIEQVLTDGTDSFQGYNVPRKAYFLRQWIRGAGWYPGYSIRLIRNGSGHFDDKAVHEALQLSGKAGSLKGDILHFSYESIDQYISRLNRYTDLEVLDMLENPLSLSRTKVVARALFRPIKVFFKKYLKQGGVRDGMHGFLLSVFSSYYVFMTYAKYWEALKRLHGRKATDRV